MTRTLESGLRRNSSAISSSKPGFRSRASPAVNQQFVVAPVPREIKDRVHDRAARRDEVRRCLRDVVKRQFQMPVAGKRTMVLAS